MPRGIHILLPDDLLREIDALVGPRGRISFLVETACTEVRRQKLIQFLESGKPAWGSGANAHAELAGGSAEWVRSLRRESNPAAGREHGCTLMTDNRKDFPMNEVELYSLPADA